MIAQYILELAKMGVDVSFRSFIGIDGCTINILFTKHDERSLVPEHFYVAILEEYFLDRVEFLLKNYIDEFKRQTER